MDQKRSPIKHISDTARWMAHYRAMESERPNACFHDPYARFLAGLRGKVIAQMLPWGINNAWAIIIRTCIIVCRIKALDLFRYWWRSQKLYLQRLASSPV